MNIHDLLSQMLMLVIILVIGIVAYKTGVIDADGNKKITRLLLNITQPAMIIASAVRSDLALSKMDTLEIFFCGCVMYVVLFALVYLLTPLFGKDRHAAVCRFLVVFGNVAFMGFPVISALYGSDAVLIAAIYVIPFNLLAYSVGILMLTGGKGGKIDWKLVINPALVAAVLALLFVFFKVRLPNVLSEALNTVGSMTVPGAMLVIGVTLGSASVKSLFSDWHVYVVSIVRLLLAPLSVWLVCRFVLTPLFPDIREYIEMLIVLSAMPSATTTTMLCIEHDLNPQLASNSVFLTTVLSIVTVPLMVYLLLL